MPDLDWDTTVFVLLAPDALARHHGRAVLDRLARAGYAPVGWRLLWHRPADLDAFHEQNITRAWKAYLYRLVDRLFAYGPTVALQVADQRAAPGRNSHARLRAVKGGSEPADSAAGTIRGDLGSINAMLALMHSADTPADSRHESAVFTGDQGFEYGDPAGLRAALELLERGGVPERRGYPQVLAGVRARLLAAAWPELGAPARATVAGLLAGGADLAAAGTGGRLAEVLPAGHPLRAVLCHDFSPDDPGPDIDRIRPVLRPYGTDLDPWEDLVLATSRRFSPRRAPAR